MQNWPSSSGIPGDLKNLSPARQLAVLITRAESLQPPTAQWLFTEPMCEIHHDHT
jgi:hypothetical protein